jgi:hypothetical protein
LISIRSTENDAHMMHARRSHEAGLAKRKESRIETMINVCKGRNGSDQVTDLDLDLAEKNQERRIKE